ncbi:MAG TPA: hypothetical protein PK674_02535 [Candidatus Absconditabacterales bacterium]|nr:hypothetical protein [Candidatus Absconditabacterales bacterium]HPK28118.1 hypothetical protein [Candidatus Absconditabacterales bacterium]
MKIYFKGDVYDKKFENFRGDVEYLLAHFSYPTLEEIEKEDKFIFMCYNMIVYIIGGKDIIIKDEIKVNPKKYYPKNWKIGDNIPSDTVNKMVAAKLGIDWELFRNILHSTNGSEKKDGSEKKESYKKKVFYQLNQIMTNKSDNYLNEIIKSLQPGELLILTRTDDGRIFKGKGNGGIPNGIGRWTNNDGDVFWGKFIDGIASGPGFVKLNDGQRFEGIRENGAMKAKGLEKGGITFHIEALNYDNIVDKMIIQRNEDGGLSVFKNRDY